MVTFLEENSSHFVCEHVYIGIHLGERGSFPPNFIPPLYFFTISSSFFFLKYKVSLLSTSYDITLFL